MEIPDYSFEELLEKMRQVQITLRNLRSEFLKWRQMPVEPATPGPIVAVIDPPTGKQILFLRGLGVEEIPVSKEEARRLLQELNAKKEAGEYSVPPTEKQLKYLRDLNYVGPIPVSKDEAWKLLQEFKGIE